MLPTFAVDADNQGFSAADYVYFISATTMRETQVFLDSISVDFKC